MDQYAKSFTKPSIRIGTITVLLAMLGSFFPNIYLYLAHGVWPEDVYKRQVLLLCSCGVQDTPAPDPQPAPAESCTISGSFTATVRDVIPDYCLDDTTPLVAVVTEFQSQPFTVYVGEELGKKLLEEQNGQPLVFTVTPLTVDRSREEVQKLSTASLLREFNLQITDCRPAEDGELGLESLHLTIE